MKFEIVAILNEQPQLILVRQLPPLVDFEITGNSRLAGTELDKGLSYPRALDENGNSRRDLFVFKPLGKIPVKKLFKAGEIVDLTSGIS